MFYIGHLFHAVGFSEANAFGVQEIARWTIPLIYIYGFNEVLKRYIQAHQIEQPFGYINAVLIIGFWFLCDYMTSLFKGANVLVGYALARNILETISLLMTMLVALIYSKSKEDYSEIVVGELNLRSLCCRPKQNELAQQQ